VEKMVADDYQGLRKANVIKEEARFSQRNLVRRQSRQKFDGVDVLRVNPLQNSLRL
jgi:hypothetical protein